METITAKVTTRDNKLPSGRKIKRIYCVTLYEGDTELYSTPYMMTPESAIKYLRSTGCTHRHIDVMNGFTRHIHLNDTTYVVDNGKTYTLFYKDEPIKNFRAWHRIQEFMLSGNLH